MNSLLKIGKQIRENLNVIVIATPTITTVIVMVVVVVVVVVVMVVVTVVVVTVVVVVMVVVVKGSQLVVFTIYSRPQQVPPHFRCRLVIQEMGRNYWSLNFTSI